MDTPRSALLSALLGQVDEPPGQLPWRGVHPDPSEVAGVRRLLGLSQPKASPEAIPRGSAVRQPVMAPRPTMGDMMRLRSTDEFGRPLMPAGPVETQPAVLFSQDEFGGRSELDPAVLQALQSMIGPRPVPPAAPPMLTLQLPPEGVPNLPMTAPPQLRRPVYPTR